MLFLLSLPLAILAFIFEAYPRFLNREYGVDIWTHLLYLKEFHKQKHIPGRIENGFLVPGEYDYPPAFILILSRISFRFVKRYDFLFSPFFDALHIVVIFFLAYFISESILIALTTQLLYLLTPIIILENASATPRSLGYALFTILMTSTLFYLSSGNLVLLLVAVISGSFIFLTHRFTTQGYLFFATIFSLILGNVIFLGIFLLSFLIALIISKGFYLKVLRGHLGNLNFWRKNIEYRFAHQVKGNVSAQSTKDFVFRLYNQFLKFPPFVLEITNPWTLPVLYIFFFEFPKDILLQRLTLWVVISYTLAISTIWVKRLRFLGEGQRYLELSAFPTAFLASNFLFNQVGLGFTAWSSFYLLIALASLVTIIVIQRKAIIKEKLRTVTPEMEKMFSFLKSLNPKPKLLCIPHQITTSTIYHTGCPVFVNADYANIHKISDIYPYIKKPIPEIMKQYNLDIVLLNTQYAKVEDLNLKTYRKIKEIGNFILLKLK